jgi:enoyl-CoA hydratase/carnithine racemase
MGLVWRVVPHDELMDHARGLADRLVAGAPLAQRAMKELAMRAGHLSTLDALRFAETMRRVVAGTHDAAEGRRAAAERRPPRWEAR